MRRIRFELRWRWANCLPKFQMAVAWKLPRWLVRWAVVRAYARATTTEPTKTPDELTYREVYAGAENA